MDMLGESARRESGLAWEPWCWVHAPHLEWHSHPVTYAEFLAAAEEAAVLRYEAMKDHPFFREMGAGAEGIYLPGFMGESAYAHRTGLTTKLTIQGTDNGCDFNLVDVGVIDVKTAKPAVPYVRVNVGAAKHMARVKRPDYFVLATWDRHMRDVPPELIGWCDRDLVLSAPINHDLPKAAHEVRALYDLPANGIPDVRKA